MRSISFKATMLKRAQEEKEEVEEGGEVASETSSSGSFVELTSALLALLRAQYLNYQTSHWQADGRHFYSDHLLFERLYKSVKKESDTLAEKMVCKAGSDAVSLKSQCQKISALCCKWDETECPYQRGIETEELFQKVVKETYDKLKESGELSLGMDDYLMALANDHETNMYLLKRTLE